MKTAILFFALALTLFAAREEATSARERAIVPIAALCASGEIDRLKIALGDGLDAGLSVSEIKEILIQLYAYAGFPRSLNALSAFMEVTQARAKNGVKDRAGEEAAAPPSDQSRLQFGAAMQTRLVGAPVKGAIYEFAPAIDVFLKEHLFADIFARGVLSLKDREIATIAALANIKGAESQLAAHIRIGMNTGLTQSQLAALADTFESAVDRKRAEVLREALNIAAPRH
jgi:alkylhydroperoxidase/carboxymuconolactone decarboxylase family protein YurZ